MKERKWSLETQEYKTFLSLPAGEAYPPSCKERISAYILVFIPWAVIYEAFIYLGIPVDAIPTNLPFEGHLPVWEFTEVFYAFTFLFALLVPLIIKTKEELRRFITDLWFATTISGIIYLTFPFIVSQRGFIPHTFPGHLIMFERSLDGETCALPSFHVIWAFIAARYYTSGIKRYKWIWYFLAVLISVSCITTGNHSISDVIAGFLVYSSLSFTSGIYGTLSGCCQNGLLTAGMNGDWALSE